MPARSPISVFLRLSAVAVLSVTAGCADLRWQRDGVDTARRDTDFEDCRQEGRAQSTRLAWPFPRDRTRMVAFDRSGRAVLTPYPFPTWLDTDRSVREFELTGDCMRRKGYSLAPPDQGARP